MTMTVSMIMIITFTPSMNSYDHVQPGDPQWDKGGVLPPGGREGADYQRHRR